MMHPLVWDGRRKVGELRWEAGSALSQCRGGEGMAQAPAASPGQGEGVGPWRAASHWWKHWNCRAALAYRQGCHCQRQWWGAAFPSCSYCCISSPQRGPSLSHWKFTVTWTICKHNHFIYRNCRKYIYFQHGCLQHYSRLTVFWLELFFFPLELLLKFVLEVCWVWFCPGFSNLSSKTCFCKGYYKWTHKVIFSYHSTRNVRYTAIICNYFHLLKYTLLQCYTAL